GNHNFERAYEVGSNVVDKRLDSTGIGLLKGKKIVVLIFGFDNNGRVVEFHEYEIHQNASGSAVSIVERVYTDKPVMELCRQQYGVDSWFFTFLSIPFDEVIHFCRGLFWGSEAKDLTRFGSYM